MGLELELSSELPALRPIRVTAAAVSGGARDTTTTRPDDGAAGSGDAGVQEESGATVRQGGGGGGGGEKDDGAAAAAAAESGGCVTPTSAASELRPVTVCPSAPRKPRPAKRMKHCGCGARPRRPFFPVPHDLAAVFVARGPAAASPPCPPCPPAKKIRVHAVGSSVSPARRRSLC